MNGTVESWFVNPEEKQISILGQGYLASILQGSISRSVLVLTQDRLYQRGTVMEYTATGRWISTKGHKVVEIKTITGSAFKEISNVGAMWAGIIFAVLTIIGNIPGFSGVLSYPIVSLVFFACAIGCFITYFVTRARIFYIEYPGGKIGTKASWYTPNEIFDFQKDLSRAVGAKS